MKNRIPVLSFIAILIFSITLSSCVKPKTSKADDSQNSKDANSIANAVDANSDDAAARAGQVAGFAGKTTSSGWYMLCGQTVVDTGNGHTIKITYDGTTNCNGVKRTGTVVVTLNNGSPDWSVAGATATMLINNVVVTDAGTGNGFTLNGTQTITNETGGLAWQLWWNAAPGTVVKHREQSTNMSVKFSDGTTGTWSVDRTRTWSLSSTTPAYRTFSVSSEHAGNTDTWGTNRYNESFTTSITQTISANDYSTNCWWRPYTGKYVYSVPARNATASITFGTNSVFQQIGTATTCAPGYTLNYTLSTYNYAINIYLPYW